MCEWGCAKLRCLRPWGYIRLRHVHTHAHAKQLHSLPVFDAYHAHDGMKACATATMAPPHAHIVEHISTSRWCRSWGSRTHACTHTTHTHTRTRTRVHAHTLQSASAPATSSWCRSWGYSRPCCVPSCGAALHCSCSRPPRWGHGCMGLTRVNRLLAWGCGANRHSGALTEQAMRGHGTSKRHAT